MAGGLSPRLPLIMGVVNVTPDSFSDGGEHDDTASAVAHALRLLDEGADWVDVGGESTRPGSDGVTVREELHRVLPVVRGIHQARPHAVISVDTSKVAVADEAIAAGASVINDVTGLESSAMRALCAQTGVTVVIMHKRGRPAEMQAHTDYSDLVEEVADYLARQARLAMEAGVPAERILVDPGIGFGKSLLDNPRLIAAVPRFAALGHRVLIGASRKRFIGEITGVQQASQRVFGSVGAALAAARARAHVLRVHDVRATREALAVYMAVEAHWST